MAIYNEYVKNTMNKGKRFGLDQLQAILFSEIKDQDLFNYVEDIKELKNTPVEAAYYPEPKILGYNLHNINQNLFGEYINSKLEYTEQSFNRFSNYTYLLIIFHELEHVIQNKESKENSIITGPVKTFIDEGIELSSRYPKRATPLEKVIYSNFPNTVLVERDAELTGILKVLELNKEIDVLTPNELKYLNNKLINLSLKHYFNNGNPSEAYYTLRGKQEEYKNIIFNDNQDNITKIKWGYPLDKELIDYIKDIQKNDITNPDISSKILNYKK